MKWSRLSRLYRDEDDLKESLKTPDIGAHIYICRPVRTGVSHFCEISECIIINTAVQFYST